MQDNADTDQSSDGQPANQSALPLELPDEHAAVLEDPPEFTEEQLTYLEAVLRIPCCHVTGMHEPRHFVRGDYICKFQMLEAFKRAIRSLDLNPPAASEGGCGWCDRKDGDEIEPYTSWADGTSDDEEADDAE